MDGPVTEIYRGIALFEAILNIHNRAMDCFGAMAVSRVVLHWLESADQLTKLHNLRLVGLFPCTKW